MPKQLIYTSYPTGILSGRSGFQTVAASPGASSTLSALLEKESSYDFGKGASHRPVIHRFWSCTLGDGEHHILTRISPSGNDATGRPNHIAHHLIFDPAELPACPPPAIFLYWNGWLKHWSGITNWEESRNPLPAKAIAEPFGFPSKAQGSPTWKKLQGVHADPKIPFNLSGPLVFPYPAGQENTLLQAFLESQSTLNPALYWAYPFTTCLAENDNPSAFTWIGRMQDPMVQSTPLPEGWAHQILDLFKPEITAETTAIPDSKPANLRSSTVRLTPVEEISPVASTQAGKDSEDPDRASAPILQGALADGSAPPRHLHPEGILDDIFARDESTEPPIIIPDVNFDESSVDLQRKSPKPFLALSVVLGAILLAAFLVISFPKLLSYINHTRSPADPSRISTPSQSATAPGEADHPPPGTPTDPLGEIGAILSGNEFLPARAYLLQNQNNASKSSSADVAILSEWVKTQQGILRDLNVTLARLEAEVISRELIPGFEERVRSVRDDMDKLAVDLKQTTLLRLEKAETSYRTWLADSRLPIDEAPLFFLQYSPSGERPAHTFHEVDPQMLKWMDELSQNPTTSQIESVQVDIIPFRGLGDVAFPTDNRLPLSFWRKSPGSFVCSLDKSIEILQFDSKPDEGRTMNFEWMFDYRGSVTSGNQLIRFPSPPLLVRFRNTGSGQVFFVLCNSSNVVPFNSPPDIPFSLLEYDASTASFTLLDPVLTRKLRLFALPEGLFLRMRSKDDKFHFAWDPGTATFQLFETWDFEIQSVRGVQEAISREFAELRHLQRMEVVRNTWDEFKESAFWDLGKRLLEPMEIPPELGDFGAFSHDRPVTYIDYVRSILSLYAKEKTMVRPQILEQWMAFEDAQGPDRDGRIVAYRDLLTRSARRFRTLLKSEQPDNVEHWRQMVTTLEFHLLGHQEELFLRIASLSPGEIVLAESGSISDPADAIARIEDQIAARKLELDAANNLDEIPSIDEWLLDVCSLSPEHTAFPLIRFK